MLTKESPDGAYGRILGLSQSVAALARVLGPLAAGFVFDRIGVPAPFLFAAVLLGGGFLVTRGLKRRASTNPSPPLRHAS
jgi:DHA1 family tetracycline resistance protein-like MFS transporter